MSQERPQQIFHGTVGQAAAGDIVNLAARPHIEPEFSRQCPKCEKLNQLYADRCWACAYDLAGYDLNMRKEAIRRRFLSGAIVGAALIWSSTLIGGTFALLVSAAGFFLMLASASGLKDM